MRRPAPDILRVMTDPRLFGGEFAGPSWAPWRVFLAAVFGLPCPAGGLELYRDCTGRTAWPAGPCPEAWVPTGRRGGKSRIAALVAVYLAVFRTYRLAVGEQAVVLVLAADRRQAAVVFRYARGLVQAVPMLKAQLVGETAESLTFAGGTVLEVGTASFRAVRGRTLAAVVLDEIAFWRAEDSSNPDSEIVAALRPALATIPDAKLIAISSPYRKTGELYRHVAKAWGQDASPVLAWRAASLTMNPALPAGVVQAALEEDEPRARAEYLAEWRDDLAGYVDRAVLEAAVVKGRTRVPALPGVAYVGFLDPSGGASDSQTLAIAHREADRRIVLDAVEEVRAPFAAEEAVARGVALCREYHVRTLTADRYAGTWPTDAFARYGIHVRPAGASKSELYLDALPLLTSGRVVLLDLPRLIGQLANLERRATRGGRDVIDHAAGGQDDVANAAAGAIVQAETRARAVNVGAMWVEGL